MVHSTFTTIQLVITNNNITLTPHMIEKMTETYYAAAIKYERPFKPKNLTKYTPKQTSGAEYINASAPCFSDESIEKLFYYCEDHFRDAMQMLGKEPATAYFGQWKMLLHGLAKDIWLEVLDNGDLEDNRAAYDEYAEDSFIKAMEQYILQFFPRTGAKPYILQFCPRTRAKTLQQRAMANYKFKFKRRKKNVQLLSYVLILTCLYADFRVAPIIGS